MSIADPVFLDAGLCIGALLREDPRHDEARSIVEAARRGELAACTSVGVLAEVYGALTWVGAQPPHPPEVAASAVRPLAAALSRLLILETGLSAGLRMLDLAERYGLTARRIHDARHAATALSAGVRRVYTYDPDDWRVFAPDGIAIAGPPSILPLPRS
jgi:predicted nucleic acid-binding protein